MPDIEIKITDEMLVIAARKICCPGGCVEGDPYDCRDYQIKGVAGLVLRAIAPLIAAQVIEQCAKVADENYNGAYAHERQHFIVSAIRSMKVKVVP